MAQRTPNLFLVGAMRAGTTALHEVLGAHPDIFMSPFKEPAFLTDPVELARDSRITAAAGYAGNRGRYLELFADAGGEAYVGESSTHYTKLPRITGVPERMAAFAPDARIVYLVRDPVARTLSHYRFAVRRKDERRPCLEALQAEPFYCEVSDYARQLQPYLDRFGPRRVRVVVLEALATSPDRELGGLYDWLGVPGTHSDAVFPRRNESAPRLTRARGPEVLHRIGRSGRYQRLARAAVPSRLRTAVRALLSSSVASDETSDPEVLAYLRRIHRPQVAAFERLTGRTFPEWA